MSLSDFSDLTDLSSDDDDFPPSKTSRTTTRTSKKGKGAKEYKISGVLRAPRTTSYTAKSLYGKASRLLVVVFMCITLLADQIIENAIDLDPEYQRGESLALKNTVFCHFARNIF